MTSTTPTRVVALINPGLPVRRDDRSREETFHSLESDPTYRDNPFGPRLADLTPVFPLLAPGTEPAPPDPVPLP